MKKQKVIGVLLIAALLTAFTLTVLLSSCSEKKAGDPSVTTSDAGTNNTIALTTQKQIPQMTTGRPVNIESPEAIELSTYNNPLKGKDGVGGDLWGDPFMMRYDGKYYIYCSNHTNYVFCYESTDMVNWVDKGKCAYFPGESWFTDPYAPEVTYYNGKFYMVTSLAGDGHYVLVADKPWGPFEKASENQGLSIDGHIFIDNDGKWYFYRASGDGIICYEMTSPTNLTGVQTNTGAIISDGGGSWTEGPMVIYHDGIYYLTYTGNHVLSNTYRIDYATSTKGPTRFSAAKENPLLISADAKEPVHGIGHSSTVKGPDLDSYYIVYHAMHDHVGIRTLNIDRLYMNGKTLGVMGPTTGGAQICNMPDIYAFFDDESDAEKFSGEFGIANGVMTLAKDVCVLSNQTIEGNRYTIELCVNNIEESASAGVIFGYTDENNYASALFDSKAQTLVITFVVNGEKSENAVALVKSFGEDYNFAALQSIQVENNNGAFTFCVNDRELYKTESKLGGGKVGVKTVGAGASFGYIGAVDEVGGSSAKEYYKPIDKNTGYIQADHCVERDADVFFDMILGISGVNFKAGDSFNYKINTELSGKYTLSEYVSLSSENVSVSVYVDGALIKQITLSKEDYAQEIGIFIVKDAEISAGEHILTLYVESGSGAFYAGELIYTEEPEEIDEQFSSDKDGASYFDGVGWRIEEGELIADSPGKRLYGSSAMGDYMMEFVYTPTKGKINSGILLRAKNPAQTNKINEKLEVSNSETSSINSENWVQGYYIEITPRIITLRRLNYGTETLVSAYYVTELETSYNIRITCLENVITLFINDTEVLCYRDANPYLVGMAGFRVSSGEIKLDGLKITKLDK